jgi:hypothetical protein
MREKREIKHQHWQIFDEREGLLVNTSNMLGYNSCFIDL